MSCKHENADHEAFLFGHYFMAKADPDEAGAGQRLICIDCGEWLSLGPSNDEPIEVAIELRAAEIAASGYQLHGGKLRSMHWYEGCGWNAADPDPDCIGHDACDRGEPEDGPMHLAGFLARVIVRHVCNAGGSHEFVGHDVQCVKCLQEAR